MPTFSTPTYEVGIPTTVRPLNYYRYTVADSLVRINGVLTSRKVPSAAQLEAAGEEGVDYFLGGHIYTITDAQVAELTGLGDITYSPYGAGRYGAGPYGG